MNWYPRRGKVSMKRGFFGSVPQCAPDVGNLILENLRLDEGIGPHRVQELILGHQAAGMLHQVAQDGKRFGSQQDALFLTRLPAAPQALVDRVQAEWRKHLRIGACQNVAAGRRARAF